MLRRAPTFRRRGRLAKATALACVIGGLAAAPAQAERVSTSFGANPNAYTSFGQDVTFVTARSGFRWNVRGHLRTGRVPVYGWSFELAIGPDGSRSLYYTMKVNEGEGPAPTVVTAP